MKIWPLFLILGLIGILPDELQPNSLHSSPIIRHFFHEKHHNKWSTEENISKDDFD
jgi:hypothetical protein